MMKKWTIPYKLDGFIVNRERERKRESMEFATEVDKERDNENADWCWSSLKLQSFPLLSEELIIA
jgi:hypothetical protein